MSNYYLGDIIMAPYDYTPRGFMPCNGQLLAINEHQALHSLLLTTYGGNGQTTFGLPDMRGHTTVAHSADTPDKPVGFTGGQASVRLTEANLPVHNHSAVSNLSVLQQATTENADLQQPTAGSFLAASTNAGAGSSSIYNPANIGTNIKLQPLQVAADAHTPVSETGEGEPIANIQPYLGMGFCICVDGVFPERPS